MSQSPSPPATPDPLQRLGILERQTPSGSFADFFRQALGRQQSDAAAPPPKIPAYGRFRPCVRCLPISFSERNRAVEAVQAVGIQGLSCFGQPSKAVQAPAARFRATGRRSAGRHPRDAGRLGACKGIPWRGGSQGRISGHLKCRLIAKGFQSSKAGEAVGAPQTTEAPINRG